MKGEKHMIDFIIKLDGDVILMSKICKESDAKCLE